ncbi:hypothetical protein BDZ89DRAFT_1039838 [Hymenopellis radicata]|nr:hypothetical protein BDZ89DRAFT_1039838 [Hymenopellis radicata]
MFDFNVKVTTVLSLLSLLGLAFRYSLRHGGVPAWHGRFAGAERLSLDLPVQIRRRAFLENRTGLFDRGLAKDNYDERAVRPSCTQTSGFSWILGKTVTLLGMRAQALTRRR